MPAPDRWDGWTFYMGSGWAEKVQYANADGSTKNLTGATATMEVRAKPFGSVIATPTIAITAATGVLSLSVLSSATSGLTQPTINSLNVVWYDIFVTESGGDRTCILYGTMTFYPEVTQI